MRDFSIVDETNPDSGSMLNIKNTDGKRPIRVSNSARNLPRKNQDTFIPVDRGIKPLILTFMNFRIVEYTSISLFGLLNYDSETDSFSIAGNSVTFFSGGV